MVICKSKYPYALAHHRAEELLGEAKRQCKLLAAETGEHLSAVNFEVILGNRLAGQEDADSERRKAVRTTLRPYWAVKDGATLSPKPSGTDSTCVVCSNSVWRSRMCRNKRLAELRKRFESLPSDITVEHAPGKAQRSGRQGWNRCSNAVAAKPNRSAGGAGQLGPTL